MSKKVRETIAALETKLAGDTLKLPELKVGETVLVGKFKNRKAVIKGFTTDKNGHPVVQTDKGDYQVFKFRLAKLMPTE